MTVLSLKLFAVFLQVHQMFLMSLDLLLFNLKFALQLHFAFLSEPDLLQ